MPPLYALFAAAAGGTAHCRPGRLGLGFTMTRKKGKLMGDIIGHEYELEYGTDTIEIQSDAVEKACGW